MKTEIPTDWTFRSSNVAQTFDSHVREQLPWYDLATRAVAHLGRHYIPQGGLVYDVGASTGNIQQALADTLRARDATFIAIEESSEMLDKYAYNDQTGYPCFTSKICDNALKFAYEPYDFAVCFLAMMFFPVAERREWFRNMQRLIRPGGAFVLVDKIATPPGYVGTALRRMAMQWKRDSGTSCEDIVAKELSLAGYQRPINPHLFYAEGQIFFWFGEFVGWVFERNDQ